MRHEDKIPEIIELSKRGFDDRYIYRKLGVPPTSFYRLCRKLKIGLPNNVLMHRMCGFETDGEFLSRVAELYASGMSVGAVATTFGVTYRGLFEYLQRNHFEFRSVSEWRELQIPQVVLTDGELQVVDGALLGDGYLSIRKKTGHFAYTCHYRTVVENLKSQLGSIWMNIKQQSYADSRTNKRYTSYVGESRCYQIFTDLRSKWYPNGVKIVPRDIKLTPVVCYWWYLGDGTSKSTSLALCTNGFTADDVEFLSSAFPVKSQIYMQNGQPMLYITKTEDRIEFLNYIGRCRHQEYNHRWIIHNRSGDITDFCYNSNLISNDAASSGA